MPVLSYHDVGVVYANHSRRVDALSGVTFTIDETESIAVVGESGSGKSTLGKVGVGLLRPTSGSVVSAEGIDLASAPPRLIRTLRPALQLITQNPYQAFSSRLRLSRSLLPAARRFRRSSDPRQTVIELFERMGLSPEHLDRYPHELSGGQLQRAALPRALLPDPRLLIADEVMSGIGVAGQEEATELLRSYQEERGFAMLFITHDLGLARQVADRILVMEDGRIVEQGLLNEVLDAPQHPATARLLEAIPCLPPPAASGQGRTTGSRCGSPTS